jgi:3-oxoacyl-[acyl-carrier-protein] synthase-1
VRLAAGSFEDMVHASALPPLSSLDFWRRTGLIALAPIIDPERFLWSLETQPEALLEFYARPLIDLLGIPMTGSFVRALGSGHCGLAEALQLAQAEIATRRLDRIVILGADSYIDPLSLDWLAQHRRLKTPTRQTGTLPGEAGACLLLESESSARARGTTIGAHVEAVALEGPVTDKQPSAPNLGFALAEMLKRSVLGPVMQEPFRGEVLLDLNGEEWKANTWGHAQVRLTQHIDFNQCRLVLPCESLGEIGAASGPVAACMAVGSFVQKDTPPERSIICSLSDTRRVAAVLLKRPPQTRPITTARS